MVCSIVRKWTLHLTLALPFNLVLLVELIDCELCNECIDRNVCPLPLEPGNIDGRLRSTDFLIPNFWAICKPLCCKSLRFIYEQRVHYSFNRRDPRRIKHSNLKNIRTHRTILVHTNQIRNTHGDDCKLYGGKVEVFAWSEPRKRAELAGRWLAMYISSVQPWQFILPHFTSGFSPLIPRFVAPEVGRLLGQQQLPELWIRTRALPGQKQNSGIVHICRIV